MEEIKIDRRNYRKHSSKNKELIKKSLAELGTGRSILLDSENEIIAGNGVYEQAQNLNIPIKVIETDGTELVAIKRNDLKTRDKKRKELAIMDNSTSDASEFDFEMMQEDFEISELLEMGVDLLEEEASGGESEGEGENPEVEFAEQLNEEHNYIVLYFDNEVDWLQALSLFELKQVKCERSKAGFEKRGLGRVIRGARALETLRKKFTEQQ